MLEPCWNHAGTMLARCWTDAGTMLQRCCNDAGTKLERCCNDVGTTPETVDDRGRMVFAAADGVPSVSVPLSSALRRRTSNMWWLVKSSALCRNSSAQRKAA